MCENQRQTAQSHFSVGAFVPPRGKLGFWTYELTSLQLYLTFMLHCLVLHSSVWGFQSRSVTLVTWATAVHDLLLLWLFWNTNAVYSPLFSADPCIWLPHTSFANMLVFQLEHIHSCFQWFVLIRPPLRTAQDEIIDIFLTLLAGLLHQLKQGKLCFVCDLCDCLSQKNVHCTCTNVHIHIILKLDSTHQKVTGVRV